MIFSFHKSLRKCPDEELMWRISAKDDEEAFDVLYGRYARRLQGFLFRMLCGDASSAEDFTQETFMRLWAARSKYKSGSAVRPWLFTIAYNLCRNEYRHGDNVAEHEREEICAADEAYEDGTELRLDAEALDRALAKELEKLTHGQRTLFALRYEEELTVPQVAMVLGIPEGTVKSRLHHLMFYLKSKLKAYENI